MLVGKRGSFKLKSWYKNDKSLSLNVASCLIFQAVLRGSCGLIHGGLRMKSDSAARNHRKMHSFMGGSSSTPTRWLTAVAFCYPTRTDAACDRCAIERTRAESVSVAALGRRQRTVCTPLILKRHDRRVIEFPAAATKINSPQPLRHGIAILENTTQYYCNNNAPKWELTPEKGSASNCQTVKVSGSREVKVQYTCFTIWASHSLGLFKNPRYPAVCINGVVCVCVCACISVSPCKSLRTRVTAGDDLPYPIADDYNDGREMMPNERSSWDNEAVSLKERGTTGQRVQLVLWGEFRDIFSPRRSWRSGLHRENQELPSDAQLQGHGARGVTWKNFLGLNHKWVLLFFLQPLLVCGKPMFPCDGWPSTHPSPPGRSAY